MSRFGGLVPLAELSNFDVDRIATLIATRRAPYGGCVPKDEIDSVPRGSWCVINLENHELGGSHWTALYDCDPHTCIYIDSFGAKPPNSVLRWMARTGKRLIYNGHVVQNLRSQLCGYFALVFIHELIARRSITDIAVHDFWPPNDVLGTEMNDGVIVGFIERLGWPA